MSHAEGLSDDLIPLLRGELSRERTRTIVDHLLECPECSRELVDAVDVHAALMNAWLMLNGRGGEHLTAPGRPDGQGSDDYADATDSAAATDVGDGPEAGTDAPSGLRTLASVPDPGRSPSGDPIGPGALPPLRLPRGPRRHRGRLAVAAAIIVAVGAGGVVAERTLGRSDPARSVALQAVTGDGEGSVTMRGPGARTTMTIDTANLKPPTSGHFYYAWLLDPATQKMLPLGVVNADATSTFSVPTELVGRYGAVDISLQDDNGDPNHSATSVLRAQY